MTMPQYTSEEQMKELSEEAYERLTKWMIDRGHLEPEHPWEQGTYDLSIGEMLHFLEEHPSDHYGNLAQAAMIEEGRLISGERMINNLFEATRGILEYE